MKKLLGLSLSMILALPLIALAQSSGSSTQSNTDTTQSAPTSNQNGSYQGSTGQNDSTMGKGSRAAKSGSVKGTISEDGKSLVSDTDGKSWTIANPDAVKGHEGHHVELKGSTDATSGEIQVTSVKMLKGEKGSMKKDTNQPQ